MFQIHIIQYITQIQPALIIRQSNLIQSWREKMRGEDQQDLELLMQNYQKKKKANQLEQNKSRKKVPDEIVHFQQMEVEYKAKPKIKFQDLPEDVEMYLIEIYPFGNKLFMTGIMENGQTLSIVANELYKEIYFVLKNQGPDENTMSEKYLQRAEQQIKDRLRRAGIPDGEFFGQMVDMQYVFQIQQIPRNRRKYYKVRYSFKIEVQDQIEPDWQGQTFKYVIGTTYTGLELLIINKRIQGPQWIRIQKSYLNDGSNKNVGNGLCAEIQFPELIEVIEGKEPPTVRVMSFSIKEIVPATILKRKYFPDNKDDSQIYAISCHFCEDYKINIKDERPKLVHKTFYLSAIGSISTLSTKEFITCGSERDLLSQFEAYILKTDPDFLVCHDSSKILDSLIFRYGKIDKNQRTKLSRLKIARDVSKNNQVQRINSFIAGRLLVDTYIHSKEMVKLIEYDLQNIAQIARPHKKFTGISDEESKKYFNEQTPLVLVNKCREQSELTFEIMNHFELIQMTRSLSNICGNLWKRSLENKRAERNEFLIMHECKKRNLIIPDKFKKQKAEDEEVQGKKKYQGGMVFEPEKGFYSDYILLLDFNSLYPSIIRQYNVCFSIIDRPKLSLDFYYKSKAKKKEKKQKTEMQEENPEENELQQMFANVKSCKSRDQWGFLPQLIHNIVQQRKKCKKKMKKTTNPVQIMILQIQQKCYKVVANSIYGCLGLSVSRFYSMPLAALITKKGRDSLLSARDIVSKKGGVRVIYGDTDSLMIFPTDLQLDQKMREVDRLKQLKKVADQLKADINKLYTFLQIDIDGIFKPLILLMKKKYVANKLTNFEQILAGITNQPKFSLQYKGIEIVRRDGCSLVRDILQKVINILINSDDTQLDIRYQKIIDLFTKLNTQIVNQPLNSFLFSKQLTKKPKDYGNAEHLPHVKVANDRIAGGEKDESLVNHAIYYLICKPRDQNNTSLAKNAWDKKEYERTQKSEKPQQRLQIDYDYYKSMIIEPVGRLLVNINNQIYDQIAKILEISKNRIKNISDEIDNEYQQAQKLGEAIGNNLKSKANEFAKEIGQNLKCIQCATEFSTTNADTTVDLSTLINVNCPKPDCRYNMTKVLYNKIRFKMKQQEESYYNNRRRCLCTKTYDITNIVPCCDLEKKSGTKKSDISFKLHSFLYLTKDLCEIVVSQLKNEQKKGKILQGQAQGLEKIIEMVQNFLTESNYEIISDALCKLKL